MFLISTFLYSQEQLNLGDNILQYVKDNPPSFKTEGTDTFQIDEGRIDYFKYKDVTDKEDLKILVINDTYIVGALQNINGRDRLYFDITGDGVLDSEIDFLIVPFWVIASTSQETSDSGNNNIEEVLDRAFAQFNSDENPYDSGSHLELVNNIVKVIADSEYPNRDLYYALFSYYLFGNNYPWEALQSLDYLSQKYRARYGDFHPLFYLQTIESLINGGYKKEAKPLIDDLLEISPEFVPGHVYKWQLEEDSLVKEKLYSDLKANYPDHWIVKQL